MQLVKAMVFIMKERMMKKLKGTKGFTLGGTADCGGDYFGAGSHIDSNLHEPAGEGPGSDRCSEHPLPVCSGHDGC